MRQKLIKDMIIALAWFSLPCISYASFIETTIGTAVVNDATAAYFNPAALMLVNNTQIIPLGTISRFNTEFTGQSTSVATGFSATGSSNSTSYYYSPSFYFALPINNKFTMGLALVTNFANRDPEQNSILRYVQSSNTIQDYDLVPAFSVKINDNFSLGGGINFSYLKFDLEPIIGFPGTNIPDGQSTNKSTGSGVGANAGFLLRPMRGTLIGFNYRTLTTYTENGTSTFNGTTQVSSDHYHFKLRTPPRSIFSISQLITPTVGLITTIQRIQWSVTRNINVYDLATPTGVTNASIPYYLHNTWILTLGGNYKFKPNWIVRVAGTYNQSPSSGDYQISTGDSYILGTSLGYTMNKLLTIDGSYAHAFIKDEGINMTGSRFLVNGTNKASRDAVSLKLTFNL